jgi:hypothetical protein
MYTVHEELVRQRQREMLANAASRRVAERVHAAQRWQRTEAWAKRRRLRAERASREVNDAR